MTKEERTFCMSYMPIIINRASIRHSCKSIVESRTLKSLKLKAVIATKASTPIS